MGASLGVQAAAAVGGAVVGGAVARAVTGQPQTARAVATDAVIGLVTFGLVRGGSAAISSLRSSATRAAGGAVAADVGASGAALRQGGRSGARATATEATEGAAQRSRAVAPRGPGGRVGTATGEGAPRTPTPTGATTPSQGAGAPPVTPPGVAATPQAPAVAPQAPAAVPQAPVAVPQAAAAPAGAAPPAAAPSPVQYRIGEGVRRSVATRELGQPDVAAQVMGSGQPPTRIPLNQLGVTPDKSTIFRDPRFQSVLRGVGLGEAPPIEVFPVPPGGGQNLVPVPQIRLLRWRGP